MVLMDILESHKNDGGATAPLTQGTTDRDAQPGEVKAQGGSQQCV